jgi:hypothetical protein
MSTTHIFAIGPLPGFLRLEALLLLLKTYNLEGKQCTQDKDIIIVEVSGKDPLQSMASVLACLGDVPYAASSSSECLRASRSLKHQKSRRDYPIWHACEDWFQAHKQEFLEGEFVVIQESEVKLRTRSQKEAYDYLEAHGGAGTLFHEMVGDGVEMKY